MKVLLVVKKLLAPKMIKSSSASGEDDPIFRGFERSNVIAIQQAVSEAPERYSVQFLMLITFWTVAVSAAAGYHGANGIAQNMTPHIAFYCATIGFFFYPVRLFWIPVLAFTAVFAYPIVQPFVQTDPWFENSALSPKIIFLFFISNLIAAGVIAWGMRVVFDVVRRFFRSHMSDLILAIATYVICTIVSVLLLECITFFLSGETAANKNALGIGVTFQDEAMSRILRGSVVMTAFFLAMIEAPSKKELLISACVAFVYPLLAILQMRGYVLLPTLDTLIVSIILVLVLPMPIALFTPLIGFPIYIVMTGHYIKMVPYYTQAEAAFEYYTNWGLFIVVFIVALRSYRHQLYDSIIAMMKRLNRVRRFIGSGGVVLNNTTGHYRADKVASVIAGIPEEGGIDIILKAFDFGARDILTRAFSSTDTTEKIMTLTLDNQSKSNVEVMIWSERSPSGDKVSYGVIRATH